MLGTLLSYQPTLFGELVLPGWVKLCQGFIPTSVTYIVPVGWVKPLAAYPAKKSMNSKLDKPKPVKNILLDVS